MHRDPNTERGQVPPAYLWVIISFALLILLVLALTGRL